MDRRWNSAVDVEELTLLTLKAVHIGGLCVRVEIVPPGEVSLALL